MTKETFIEQIKASTKSIKCDLVIQNINIIDDKYDCPDCDALLLLTEWSEFREIDWQAFKLRFPSCSVVFDGRNIYDRKCVEDAGMKYFGIGQ